MEELMDYRLYTTKTLRDYLQVARSTLYDLISDGLAPTFYIGISPRWTPEAVSEWLSTRTKRCSTGVSSPTGQKRPRPRLAPQRLLRRRAVTMTSKNKEKNVEDVNNNSITPSEAILSLLLHGDQSAHRAAKDLRSDDFHIWEAL
jgi:predicted DNA-binding transcriptional regulator AlpA